MCTKPNRNLWKSWELTAGLSFTSKEMDRVCFQRKQILLTHVHPGKHYCALCMSQSSDLSVLPSPCCSSVRSGIGTSKFSIAVPVWEGIKSTFRIRSLTFLVFCLWFSANTVSLSGPFSFEITSLFHIMIHLPSWDSILDSFKWALLAFGY